MKRSADNTQGLLFSQDGAREADAADLVQRLEQLNAKKKQPRDISPDRRKPQGATA